MAVASKRLGALKARFNALENLERLQLPERAESRSKPPKNANERQL